MIQYILEVIVFQMVFLLAFDFLLKRETFFQWNRGYLIATFFASLVLPLIRIEALSSKITEPFTVPISLFLDLGQEPEIQSQTLVSFWERFSPLAWVYFGMAFAMLLWFLFKFNRIIRLKAKGEKRYFPEFTQVTVQKSSTAFSFFKTIFLGETIPKSKLPQIVSHELVHVRQWHSLDLLIFELMRILFWFNPLVYSYQKRLAELHEFIADAHLAKENRKEQYQALLAEAFQTQNLSFTNPFFKSSLIKKRIVMLNKNQSKKVYRFKYFLFLPLVFGMLCYVACNVDGKQEPESIENRLQLDGKDVAVPFTMVDQVPVFPGCENAPDTKACFIEKIQAHIRKNFHYPKKAEELGIQGRVSLVFVVDEQGAITNIRQRGPHELLEQEAVRIIELLPQMQPGQYQGKAVKVPFSIPITFKLNLNDHSAEK